jgi:hypothetical protein
MSRGALYEPKQNVNCEVLLSEVTNEENLQLSLEKIYGNASFVNLHIKRKAHIHFALDI